MLAVHSGREIFIYFFTYFQIYAIVWYMYKQVTIILLVVIASIYLCFNYQQKQNPAPITITWSFETKEAEDMNPPQTKVTVTVDGNEHDAGTHDGTCASVQPTELESGELSGALCWWAGGGTEIGVFKENGKIILKKRSVDEGTAEEAGAKSNFELLLTL
jgi:hypothetical protein